jgi:hypothetical protein
VRRLPRLQNKYQISNVFFLSKNAQTDSHTQLVPYSLGTGFSPRGKSEQGLKLNTNSSAGVKNVCLCMLSWHVQGQLYLYLYLLRAKGKDICLQNLNASYKKHVVETAQDPRIVVSSG